MAPRTSPMAPSFAGLKLAALCALGLPAWAAERASDAQTAATTAVLRQLRVTNRCALPVMVYEAQSAVVPPGASTSFTSGVDLSRDRISLMYQNPYISENLAVLELNGLFKGGIGVPGPRFNVNFIAQWGFMDLPIEVAFWADAARTRLVCQDGRARCNFKASDCAAFTDGSAVYEQRTVAGKTYGYCRSTRATLTNPDACIGQYATYLSDRCQVFDRSTGQWRQQARSVGFKGLGWNTAHFWDNQVLPSTMTGRHADGPGVMFECFEAPCISTSKSTCIAQGKSSVGNAGFAVQCDASASGLVDVAVLEITACPSMSLTSEAEPGANSTASGAWLFA